MLLLYGVRAANSLIVLTQVEHSADFLPHLPRYLIQLDPTPEDRGMFIQGPPDINCNKCPTYTWYIDNHCHVFFLTIDMTLYVYSTLIKLSLFQPGSNRWE
jgi:hypothetical protein